MANFFSKAKSKSEKVETIEEVEFMPADSVEYFEEQLLEKQNTKNKLYSAVNEKKADLLSISTVLEAQKQKRQEKKKEIYSKIESLKKEQRVVAQNLALETGDPTASEEQLRELSVEILSEQAKVSVYEDEVKHYLPPNIKKELKNKIQNYEQATHDYRITDFKNDLLTEIQEVIEKLKDTEKTITQTLGSSRTIENVSDIINPYIKYFISEKEMQELLQRIDQDTIENYFTVWLNSNTNQEFYEYANRLMYA